MIEYRAYYDEQNKIVTYTTEDIPGNYIVISVDDYRERRHDAVVIDGQLIRTNQSKHVYKLVKSLEGNFRCDKYDISVIPDENDEHIYHTIRAYEIKR